MAITQDRTDDSPRKEPAPRQTHHPAVLTVERGHRILVALADPAQQPSIVAGRIVTGGEDCCADVPVRIVHL
jgi:hypothetical protein